MSLLLSSLKKADQENAQSAAQEQGAPSSQSVAPAAAQSAPGLAVESAESIDFDSVAGGAGDSSVAPDKQEKESISAARVFRAGEGRDEGGGSTGKRLVYGILGVVVLGGGGFFAIQGGLIPGVSFVSLRDMILGAPPKAPVVVAESGPVLEASSDDVGLLLPQPVVDVQSEIATFSDFTGSDALETPEGRREFAEKIAILAGVSEEDVGITGEGGLIDEQGIITASENASIDSEIEEIVIKTAEVSRQRKQSLDAKTPVDALLEQGIKRNSGIEIVAQVSEDAGEIDGNAGESDNGAAENLTEENISEPAAPAAPEKVRVTPSLSGVERQKMLGDAAKLYISGAYAEAESAYRNILSKNSTNIDALRGLALVAVATGRYQLAVATYLEILEYYPNDPVAVADLANLHGVSGENSRAIEEALKRVLGKRPEWDGRIYFALGNLYASNQRWLDAQQAYFNAYANEQKNPDYAYNLAVMLDYLNKPLLAVDYYRQALDLSKHMPSGFDAGQVSARIKIISK